MHGYNYDIMIVIMVMTITVPVVQEKATKFLCLYCLIVMWWGWWLVVLSK